MAARCRAFLLLLLLLLQSESSSEKLVLFVWEASSLVLQSSWKLASLTFLPSLGGGSCLFGSDGHSGLRRIAVGPLLARLPRRWHRGALLLVGADPELLCRLHLPDARRAEAREEQS